MLDRSDPDTDDRPIPEWVRAAAGDPRLAPLWTALARRFGEGGRSTRSVRLRGLDDEQRRALADLLRSRSLPPADTTVSVARIAAAYRITEPDVRALVEALHGPVGDRAADRADADHARRSAGQALTAAAQQAAAHHPHLDADRLVGWAARQARGTGTALTDRTDAARRVLDVLAATDASHPQLLPVAAATAFGDPHALDVGTVHGRLLDASLVAAAAGEDLTATARRDRRRRVGLLDDEISSTALVWRLPVHGGAATTELARLGDAAGQPTVWTLAQLRAHPPAFTAADVLVVENPAVLATAALRRCDRPIVCTAGVPSVAGVAVCEALADAGCRLHLHADFDPAGLRIVTGLLERIPAARPHRMDAASYLAHVGVSTVTWEAAEDVPTTVWDPPLAEVMRQHRTSVFEEQVVDDLVPAERPR